MTKQRRKRKIPHSRLVPHALVTAQTAQLPQPSKENQECKTSERAKIIKELMSLEKNLDHARTVRANFFFIVVKLMMRSLKQTARMRDSERKLIRLLRNRDLSIGEIAWILNRAKSSIHAVLNGYGESSEPNEGEVT